MYFLIDYENVNYAGLEGIEFVKRNDKVVIFYSDVCKFIPYYRFSTLLESGCDIETCRLVNTGRNALDFYIASKVGEIMSTDTAAVVAIISKDKGYKAVREYWMKRLNPNNRLVVSASIAGGIISSAERNERKAPIQDAIRKVDINNEFENYLRIRNSLRSEFEGTVHEDFIPKVMEIIFENTNAKGRYVNTLKTFGMKEGLLIYHKINDCLKVV